LSRPEPSPEPSAVGDELTLRRISLALTGASPADAKPSSRRELGAQQPHRLEVDPQHIMVTDWTLPPGVTVMHLHSLNHHRADWINWLGDRPLAFWIFGLSPWLALIIILWGTSLVL
jgi:hypothetical protein